MKGRGGLRSIVGRRGERVLVWVVVVGLIGAVGYLLFAGIPALDGERATGGGVNVSQSNGNYVLQPADGDSEVGLVFYPGGNVPAKPYVSSLEPLASETGVTVVIVKMPANLAFADQGAASRVIDRRTDIGDWYVGGHSLGGAISCRYARNNADRLDGVVLLAAYCDRSIADTDLEVLSVTGSEDVVLNKTAYERNKANLPTDSTLVTVPGMNHSQFGNYTDQPGDNPAELTYEQAHARLANVTVPWFRIGSVERTG